MKIDISGIDEVKAALTNMSADIERAAADAVEVTARSIERKVKSGINRGGRSGRVYEKTNPARTHQASAAGEAPKTDTGLLVSSVFTDISSLFATVGANAAYAAHLEYGTRNMSARPIWRPTVEEETPLFEARMIKAIARTTK